MVDRPRAPSIPVSSKLRSIEPSSYARLKRHSWRLFTLWWSSFVRLDVLPYEPDFEATRLTCDLRLFPYARFAASSVDSQPVFFCAPYPPSHSGYGFTWRRQERAG